LTRTPGFHILDAGDRGAGTAEKNPWNLNWIMPAKGITACICCHRGQHQMDTPGDTKENTPLRTRVRGTVLRDVVPPVVLVVVAIGAWQLIVLGTGLPAFILPSPLRVLQSAVRAGPNLVSAVADTLFSTTIGLVFAVALAVAVAAVMDLVPVIRRAMYPVLVASQTVQILAIAPLLIIWFGFGRAPTVLVVILFTFFPMAIATVDGLAATDRDYTMLLQSMGASRLFIWRVVRLPGALPSFFSGLRLAVTYSVVAATIGEWVGGTKGLGLYMLRSKNALQTDQVFVGVVVTTLISVGMFALVTVAERLLLRWKYRGRRSQQWIERGIY
jgi:ABC-type nitrate/sulfonate/bicarbonate transport system permease component